MSTISPSQWKHLAAVAAFTLMAACADYTPAAPTELTIDAPSRVLLSPAEVTAASDPRFPELGLCQNLQVPAGSKVTFHVFGIGVQTYRWNGATWQFVAPTADLYADAAYNGLVGTHFGGPTWLTRSGSQVVGTVATDGRCSLNNPGAIPWLKLNAVATGTGVFEQTTFIQRTNTQGGLAPTTPGAVIGDEVSVPYTSDYYFYRAP
jgi:hypothetical protein